MKNLNNPLYLLGYSSTDKDKSQFLITLMNEGRDVRLPSLCCVYEIVAMVSATL